MKNLILIFAALLCLYMYLHPTVEKQVETRVETRLVKVPVQPVAAPAPEPTPTPKLYYHSPLDAPAMPNYANTGAGFYSNDPVSHPTGPHLSTADGGGNPYTSSYYGGYPIYYPNSNGSVTNIVIYKNAPSPVVVAPTPLPGAVVLPPAQHPGGVLSARGTQAASAAAARTSRVGATNATGQPLDQ